MYHVVCPLIRKFLWDCFRIKSSWIGFKVSGFLKHSSFYIMVLISILSHFCMNCIWIVLFSKIPPPFLKFFALKFSSPLQLIAFALSFPISSLPESASFYKVTSLSAFGISTLHCKVLHSFSSQA